MKGARKLMLEARHLGVLKEIFKRCCPGAKIVAFGSRVDGSAHECSDLDLAIISGEADLASVRAALRESDLPFLVDIFRLDSLPESFKVLENCVEL